MSKNNKKSLASVIGMSLLKGARAVALVVSSSRFVKRLRGEPVMPTSSQMEELAQRSFSFFDFRSVVRIDDQTMAQVFSKESTAAKKPSARASQGRVVFEAKDIDRDELERLYERCQSGHASNGFPN